MNKLSSTRIEASELHTYYIHICFIVRLSSINITHDKTNRERVEYEAGKSKAKSPDLGGTELRGTTANKSAKSD